VIEHHRTIASADVRNGVLEHTSGGEDILLLEHISDVGITLLNVVQASREMTIDRSDGRAVNNAGHVITLPYRPSIPRVIDATVIFIMKAFSVLSSNMHVDRATMLSMWATVYGQSAGIDQ